jgi:hypothetical protein
VATLETVATAVVYLASVVYLAPDLARLAVLDKVEIYTSVHRQVEVSMK